MVNGMKKSYIHPATQFQQMYVTNICVVTSVHGGSDFQYGGGSDGSDESKLPI